jgi:hypothetical protein
MRLRIARHQTANGCVQTFRKAIGYRNRGIPETKTRSRRRDRLSRRITANWAPKRALAITLSIIIALFCGEIAFAEQPASALVGSQALWISNYAGQSFISELAAAQLLHSGIPRVALNTGHSNVGGIGKLAFDGAGDLWVPFCGNGTPINGLVAAFSPAALAQFAAGNNHIKPKAELVGSGLSCPVALAFDHSGNLWIANAGTFNDNPKSIVEYAAASLFQENPRPQVTLTSSSLNDVRSLAFDTVGDLWVTVISDSTDGVYEFTPQQLSSGGPQSAGLILRSPIFTYPEDIIFDAANNMWIAYGARILPSPELPGFGAVQMFRVADLTGSGTVEPPAAVTLGGLSRCSILELCSPRSLAFDQSGNLWIAQTDTISEFAPTQLASGNTPLAQVILAPNYANSGPLRSWNFLGAGFITFGPPTK